MHISLTETLEKWVRDKVESGLYSNASEVIREALRERIRAERTEAEDIEALRAQIDIGLQQAERGELLDWTMDDIKSRLREERNG
ncbi:MAG: type II toxin-antitoxin system ParD family antitoxin [Oceanicaulis sp.]|uniref:type II toxin-antitoxin system ParD family antitoxin n=1 Tax=Glycocaulis sp. TaxID=1969725 RepID=UPI0025B8D0D6|nr:type II toxin-antitoxin system ParD family antitoxin [Glycocaulis sp.]MCC5982372.1 type II toxin-antitoxin system ParD family antitoxin [Oceanicaulis sp.]MCH8521770.1 type II toxin-antitoxin system ParD family antitoxin [Glycocaulis sp.]